MGIEAERQRKIAEEGERRKVAGHAHFTEKDGEMRPTLALVNEEGAGAFTDQEGINIAIGVGGLFVVSVIGACWYTNAKRQANRVEMIDPEATINPVVVLPVG